MKIKNKNFKDRLYNLFFIIPGVCLFLKKAKSKVDSYDCRVFKYGCPTGPYFGSSVYKCEVLLSSES